MFARQGMRQGTCTLTLEEREDKSWKREEKEIGESERRKRERGKRERDQTEVCQPSHRGHQSGDSGTKVGLDPPARPPCTTLNLIITSMCTIPQGKLTTSQYKANKASSECALSPRNPGVSPQILRTREKKKEKQNEKGRNIFQK